MDSLTLILLAATLAHAGLAALVFFYHPSEPAHRTFALVALAVAGWTLTNALFQAAPTEPAALLWANVSYATALAIGVSLVHFSRVFPTREREPLRYEKALWALCLGASALPFVPGLVIYDITPDKRLLTRPGLYAIAAALALAFLTAFVRFARRYRKARGKERSRLGLFLMGAALSTALGLAFNLALPLTGRYGLVALGPACSLLFVGFTAYAIAAHRLFDIRLVVRRAAAYAVLLGFVFALYVALFFYLALALGEGPGPGGPFLLASVAGALVVGFSLDPLRRFIEDRTDRFLFQKRYAEEQVLRELSGRLALAVTLAEALDAVLHSLATAFHLRHAAAFAFAPGEKGSVSVQHVAQIGYGARRLFLDEEDSLLRYCSTHRAIVTAQELERAREPGVAKRLRSLGAALAVPLHLEGQPLGLILLGEKRSGDSFRPEDRGLLETVGSQAITAIQKARAYEGDRRKSEFVSVASHELLTPISAIEGYLSMILDEGMGRVDLQARGYLTKVYASAHRLSGLVRDLLSVSRIESGKLKVVPQAVDLEKLIADTLDQLRFVAAEKGLEMRHVKPKVPVPPAWADPERVTQVLVNLVGNAIKYTPEGSVTVTAEVLRHPEPMVQVSVADTGLGLTKEAQSHLFEKFYRAEGAETAGIQGTGLGLYITKSLVEKMDGSISLRSQPGQGSTFSFTLPPVATDPPARLELEEDAASPR